MKTTTTGRLHAGRESLKDMPVVTVEQIHRFREAALRGIEELSAQIEIMRGWCEVLDFRLTNGDPPPSDDAEMLLGLRNALSITPSDALYDLGEWQKRAEAAEARLNEAPQIIVGLMQRLIIEEGRAEEAESKLKAQ
jgi:hypothetical protein